MEKTMTTTPSEIEEAKKWVPCGSHPIREPGDCCYCAIDTLHDALREREAELEQVRGRSINPKEIDQVPGLLLQISALKARVELANKIITSILDPKVNISEFNAMVDAYQSSKLENK